MIGGRVLRFGHLDSTNDEAARLAQTGEPEGTVIVAAAQLRGRGRQGRPWHSPDGGCICCSAILRPARPMREWPDLSWALAAGVAVFARACGAVTATVKHPNDVLAGGRKLAGLLLETRTCGGDAQALIAGIGFNVNTLEEQFPDDLRGYATSLAILTGRRMACEDLIAPLCSEIDRWYGLWIREGADGARRAMAAAGLGATGAVCGPGGALEEAAGCRAGCG